MQDITHTSYRAQDADAAAYAEQPFWQYETVKEAIYKFVTQTSPAIEDLRGTSFAVTVSEDGNTVSVVEAADKEATS